MAFACALLLEPTGDGAPGTLWHRSKAGNAKSKRARADAGLPALAERIRQQRRRGGVAAADGDGGADSARRFACLISTTNGCACGTRHDPEPGRDPRADPASRRDVPARYGGVLGRRTCRLPDQPASFAGAIRCVANARLSSIHGIEFAAQAMAVHGGLLAPNGARAGRRPACQPARLRASLRASRRPGFAIDGRGATNHGQQRASRCTDSR